MVGQAGAPRVTRTAANTDILRGEDILCFSHDWNGDPLSKTHLMRLLARDNRILWVNSIGYRTPSVSKADMSRAFQKLVAAASPIQEPEKNLFVLSPLAIPAYGRPWIRELNRHLLRFQVRQAMRRLRFRRPISWVFNPAAAVIAGEFDERMLIYHCVDEYTKFSGVASSHLADLEQQLLTKAHLVLTSAELLYESKGKLNSQTYLVRHGVDFEHFRKALDPQVTIPPDIARLPRPIIGFFGLIADWVDLDVLEHIARHYASGSLVLIGKATTDVSQLAKLPNVHLLGRKPYDQLPAYCKGFDVAVMPFRVNELTLNANPLKVREYLAAGLPVVSTALPEVRTLGACRLADTPEDFVLQLALALGDPGPRRERSESMKSESWAARLDDIRQHVAALN